MKDLTRNSVTKHLLALAAPVAISMLAQIAYQMIDLYFITGISAAATAGVNAAGNVIFIVSAVAQMLNVGTTALIAHAVGRRDKADAHLVFNQAITLSAVLGTAMLVLFYLTMPSYLRAVAADSATFAAGTDFLQAVLPGFALTIPTAALAAALRGTGNVKPPITIYLVTVAVNATLAPVLIAGWGTGVALGAMGAGLATSASITTGIILFCLYFFYAERYLALDRALLRPRIRQWRRILNIGLPASFELILLFLSTAAAYYLIRDFGTSAQAGFGIGSRVLQVIILPGMAIGFAVAPVAGQNFGARNNERVRQTFRDAALIGTLSMAAITAFVQWRPGVLVSAFDADAEALAVATLFLQLMSWTFPLQGLLSVCSNMCQGLGNMVPSLIGSAVRFATFAVAALWLLGQSTFTIEQVWYLSIASIAAQAAISLLLLRVELKRRLVPAWTAT